ncbi:MAG: hypothetical protein ACPG5T_04770 [Endozoicomonas sp.]
MVADNRSYHFIQTVTLQGQLVDPGMLLEATYIETMDLSGPKLILVYRDPFKVIRDDQRLAEESILTVEMGDFNQLDRAQIKSEFRVGSIDEEGDRITVNCTHRTISELKRPAPQARLYAARTPAYILRDLVPEMVIDADPVPVLGDHHLHAGESRTLFLQRMAREHGAVVWGCRGALHFKKVAGLLSPLVPRFELVYEHGNRLAPYQLRSYRNLPGERSYKEAFDRKLQGWSMTGGPVLSRKHTDAPIRLHSHHNASALDGLTARLVPYIEADSHGNAEIAPGVIIPTVFHRDDAVSVVDESLPVELLVGLVAHHQDESGYRCLIEGWRPVA